MIELEIGKEKVVLNEDDLKFNEATINKFLQDYAAKYSFYTAKHAELQFLHSRHSDKLDAMKADKFQKFKNEGGSDKFVEARVMADKEVQTAVENVSMAKYKMQMMWGFLRSMDRAHDYVIQTCFNMRKEMDTIFKSSVRHIE